MARPVPRTEVLRAPFAEALGTFVLVLAAAGSVMADELSGGRVGPIGIAAAPGLAVMATVYAIGPISGAHLNPAVTLGFVAARKTPWTVAAGYVIAQFAGALLAAAALRAVLGDVAEVGAHVPAAGALESLAMEVLLTFVLMFVIMGVVSNAETVGNASGVAIGGTVALGVLLGGPVSGGSMNPARAAGPAVAGSMWRHHWIYWVGTLAGSLLAVLVYVGLDSGRGAASARPKHPSGGSTS